jgi:hypothetical protein
MRGLDRREALARMAGAAGLLTLPASPARAGTRAPTARAHDLDALADRLRATPRAETFTLASELIRAGVDIPTLLGAIFLCGVREIRPRPHGILHSVMMVGSSFQFADAASPTEAWLAVLWNLDDLKHSMEEDRSEDGDWSLPPRRQGRAQSPDAARNELVAAMEAWDAGRADRALTAFLPYCDRTELFEVLWPFLARCYAFIGHKIIYAMQVERVLGRIGWRYAEPALRSLVMASLVGRDVAAFDRSRDRARSFPAGWERGREDPAQSAALLRTLRTANPPEAQELVAHAFRDGLGPQTVWDALRLFGSEVFLKRRGRTADTGRQALLPVHALTVVNALGHAARSARLDATRRILVLQAAGWLAAMRDDLAGLADFSMAGSGIEALGDAADPGPALRPLLDEASPARLRAYLDAAPAERERYSAHLRHALVRTGQEHHQHKYAAAMQEESRLVHPRWTSRILAPAVDYIAHPKDPETEVYRRAVKAMRDAG